MKAVKLLAGIALMTLLSAPGARGAGADRDPAVAAMAGTRLSYAGSPAWAAYANPAILPFTNPGFVLTAGWQGWMPRHDGGNEFSVALGGNAGGLGYSVAGSYLAGKAYDIISSTGTSQGNFTPSDLDIAAGIGVKITDQISAGASLRYLRSSLAPSQAYNVVGASLLATWRKDAVTLTAGLTDVGTQVNGQSILPAAAALSGTYSTAVGVHGILGGADARYYFAGGAAASFGVQYSYDRMVFLRAGARYNTSTIDLPTHASVGAGLRFGGVELCVAYLFASETLSGTILTGVTYSF